MRSWKKRLNDEFDNAAPALERAVLDAPIATARNAESDVTTGAVLARRRLVPFVSVGVFAVLAAVFGFLGIFGVFSPRRAADRYVFSLEINPAVSFVTDGDGKVLRVNALNGDADVVLSDAGVSEKLNGAPLSEAVVTYTDGAAKLGYIDLTKTENAVRLSTGRGTDGGLLESTADALRGYFKANGIFAAVIEDALDASELCARLGVDGASDISELARALDNTPVRYGERAAAGATAEELKSLYETHIVGTQMLECVRGELLDNIDDIISNARLLSQMGVCNYKIMMHRDNPFSPIPVDYWTLKGYPDAEYGEEFAALMAEMDSLSAEYNSKFGVSIGGISDFTTATDVYSSLSGIDLEELFRSLTADDFMTSAAKFVGMLKNIGSDVAELEKLLAVPQTTEEYFAQLRTTLARLSASRAAHYKDIYEQQRTALTEAEYDAFVEELVREYGSLENFWDNK